MDLLAEFVEYKKKLKMTMHFQSSQAEKSRSTTSTAVRLCILGASRQNHPSATKTTTITQTTTAKRRNDGGNDDDDEQRLMQIEARKIVRLENKLSEDSDLAVKNG